MKLSVRLLSALIVVIIVSLQASSTPTLAQGEWKTIKTLSGSGNKDTEDFTVPTNYWRIVYTVTAQYVEYASFFCLRLP